MVLCRRLGRVISEDNIIDDAAMQKDLKLHGREERRGEEKVVLSGVRNGRAHYSHSAFWDHQLVSP